jgi:hypothetical protein
MVSGVHIVLPKTAKLAPTNLVASKVAAQGGDPKLGSTSNERERLRRFSQREILPEEPSILWSEPIPRAREHGDNLLTLFLHYKVRNWLKLSNV